MKREHSEGLGVGQNMLPNESLIPIGRKLDLTYTSLSILPWFTSQISLCYLCYKMLASKITFYDDIFMSNPNIIVKNK